MSQFEIEGGLATTHYMEFHGYNQNVATKGWQKIAPTLRTEYWNVKEDGWNFGIILQPIYVRYSDRLTNTMNFNGKIYANGDKADLTYQFHTARLSANYPFYQSSDRDSYIRGGISAVLRYARIEMSTNSSYFTDKNRLILPLGNIETNIDIANGLSFFTRTDFLPGIDGNIFLDGLYDVFLGVRQKYPSGNKLDAGLRMFFGGYDPKKQDEYANKIFFNLFVVRYSF
ncbi:MAG: hypothetical protein ORN98_04210 [Alphaproteobacteria bacterium]|nr:hypothetical protein [Alphaproteobacteria bacterium]